LAKLEHPHIVRLLDGGTAHDGSPYFVMEYVRGERLDKFCQGRSLATRAQAELVLTIAQAGAYAHRQGVLHRDLKPSNVLVTVDGVPKVADFGLARSFERDAELTGQGGMLGTPSYMSPEQVRGGGGLNHPTIDVYGLGAILYA